VVSIKKIKKIHGSFSRKISEYKLTHKGPVVINTRTTRARLHKLPAKEEEQKRGGRAIWIQSSQCAGEMPGALPLSIMAHPRWDLLL